MQYLRQASTFSRASARLRNQWAFRHSLRKRPLNASMKALSVGLPGREKVGPEVEVAGDELAALVDADRLRITDLGADPVERRHHVLAAIGEARIEDG